MKRIDVVGAVIYNDKKEILCALRGKGMSMSGYWEFPGGKIEPGEKPQQALEREIKEELGCTILVEELVADHVNNYSNIEVRLMTYKSKVMEGPPVASEHEELRWVSIQQLSELNWAPADIPTVENITERQMAF